MSCISGSSPRVWGTPIIGWRIDSYSRFIPTGVGNASHRAMSHNLAVHPHGCGEHYLLSAQTRILSRFIPTGVGNARFWIEALSITVHPHGCGERHSSNCSNPHARFIPTGVGNAHVIDAILGFMPVHPHGCGERYFSDSLISVHPHGCGERILSPALVSIKTVHPHGCGEPTSIRR